MSNQKSSLAKGTSKSEMVVIDQEKLLKMQQNVRTGGEILENFEYLKPRFFNQFDFHD